MKFITPSLSLTTLTEAESTFNSSTLPFNKFLKLILATTFSELNITLFSLSYSVIFFITGSDNDKSISSICTLPLINLLLTFSTIFSKLDKATVVVNPSTVAAIKGIDTFLGILLKLKFLNIKLASFLDIILIQLYFQVYFLSSFYILFIFILKFYFDFFKRKSFKNPLFIYKNLKKCYNETQIKYKILGGLL